MATLLKRGIILLYVLFCILPAGAQTFTDDDFTFKVTGEGTCSVTGTTLTSGDLIIPNTATDSEGNIYSVTSIGDQAFKDRKDFTGTLTIPESVTSIGRSAFSGCSGFTGDLIIPKNVISIGSGAFYSCSSFTDALVIPEGITSIEVSAFEGCSGFSGELIIPENVTSIGPWAFNGCSKLTGKLKIPEGVTSIGNYAFKSCSGFTGELKLPSGLTTIEAGVFSDCSGFTGELKIPARVTSIGSSAFKGCSGFTGDLTLPDGLASIGSIAFFGCSGFTGELKIPEGVTSIGYGVFSSCSGFTGSLTLPDGLTSIGSSAFEGCREFTGELKIPKNVTSIGSSAFRGCSGFTGELKLPEGLNSIGDYAFDDCSGLTGELKLPEGLNSIGGSAFDNCSGFTGVLKLPEGLTSIGNYAFYNCSGFTSSLTIPDKVTTIGNSAFSRCTSLSGTLTLGSGLETLGTTPFYNCNFTEIISLNPTPPTSIEEGKESNVFTDANKQAVLSVPAGREAAYEASPVWSGFKLADVEATGVTLSQTTASLKVGESVSLTSTIAPENATDKTVTWSSSAPAIATVDANGKVTAVAVGSANITATTTNDKTATCTVTVIPTPAESVTLDRTTATVTAGDALTLTATVLPTTTTDKTVTWTSSNTEVATVDASGKVTTLKAGTAIITATTSNSKTASCTITVKAKVIAATGISIDRTTEELTEGDQIDLTATVTPTNATDKSVSWTSSDPAVATVNASGEVTAVKAGTATITASTTNGLKATCTITVNPAVIDATGVSLSSSSLLMTTGDKRQLTATVAPEDATDKTVTWKTSNAAVATVDASGMVTAVRSASEGENSRVGTATITATTANGLQATCRVTVRPRTATIAGINHRITYADEGGGRTFATVTGGNADEDGEITVHDELLVENGNNDITVPITRIEPQAFTGRPDVTKVVIPKSVTYIGNEAFANCTALEEIIIEDAETLLDCDADVFKGSPFKSLYLGRHTAGTIYADHHSLDRLEIGELVDEIDENEFRGCDPITGLYVYAEVPPTLPDNGFDESVYENTYLHVPSASIEAYREADGWKKFNHDNHIIALDAIPAENIELSVAELPLVVGQSKQLIATITPENVTTKTLRWSSSDATVASVASNGTVLGRKVGTATITVRTVNNLTATCTVTVSPKLPESIELDRTEAQITEKTTLHLSATIFPEDVTDPTVTWTSSDETVATVDEEGLVSALTPGTVTITAATVNDLTAECTITVTAAAIPVKTISLTRTKTDIQLGLTITLRPNITPTNATDKTVTWTSSDSEVASVTEAGVVTALKLGTATITVATVNGLSATCVVTVVPRTETIGGIIYEIIPGGGEDGEDVVKVIGGDPDDDGTLRIPDEVEIDGKLYPVTEIGAGAFKDREDITKVVIPASVTKIGDEAFSGCTNLREVEAEDGDKLLACGKDAFKDAPVEELYLGRDTSGKPFAGNPELTAVTIGDKVTSIGSGDFGGCTSIVTVTVLAPEPPALADDGFERQVYNQATLYVPDGSVDDYKSASGWKNFYDILGINEIRPVDIEMELADAQLTEGETMTLKAVITPDNATNQTVTWTTSDAAVATVDASGVVTAIKAGTATITASTANGLTATCAVTVTAKPSGIEGVEGDSQPVTVEGGDIVVSGGERAEVYSITGIRVAVVSDGRVTGLPRGIYLVRLNGKTVKIRL